MMGSGSNGWWNSPSSSSSSSSSAFPQYPQTSMTLWHESQQLPESWSQLLLGGLEETEERCNLMNASAFLQPKRMENWDDLVLFRSGVEHVKHENYEEGCVNYSSWSSSTTQSLPASSPRSCVTTASLTSSMLDFSNSKAQRGNHSSECNSKETGLAFKKARVQPSTTQTTIKVRKEKLGDRITALHQLVSPFGKTDTASVLLEAIGYIRFLHSQIEALSSPYLASESGCMMHSDHGDHDDPMKDLRSRGLCLVPISFNMLHAGTENGADFWAPNCGGEFH